MSADLSAASAPPEGNVEIRDAVFCKHGKELCTDCEFDGREDNDAFFGFDPKERDPLELPPYILNKTGTYQCKKHANSDCNQCYNWKKQIQKLQLAAKKKNRKSS